MRVVFFVQGEKVPAARARGFSVARELERHNIRCELRVPYPSVYGDTRLPSPWKRLRPLYVPGSVVSRLGQLGDLHDDDILVFQRPMLELPTVFLERRLARGHKTVFDFDDAIFEGRFGGGKLRALVSLVDHVIAGNAYLARATGAPDKTTVIPTAVDTTRYQCLAPRPVRGRDVVVGWTGICTNYPHLVTALPGIARALERTGARLLLISDAPPPRELMALSPEYRPWRAETETEDLGAIDIGLMPLPDEPYERGKCAWKLIQYMALGRPGVASPVGASAEVVTDGVDGFLPTDARSWEDALVNLIDDPDLRGSMGLRAHARVDGAYSLKAVVPRYLKVFQQVAHP